MAQALALWVVLILAWLAYLPHAAGLFLFDDLSNLDGLRLLNADPTPYNALQYVLNGVSSTLGRPLTLATFAVQHGSWDQHPQDFVRVNILLHLLNGALWCWLLVRLQRLQVLPKPAWIPIAACALWLLLPIHGSAVLYVVQRMTLLAATFTLSGLLLYSAGRECAQRDRRTTGYLLMSAALAAGLGLGTLAKETAALLPMMILALEATLLRSVPRPPRWTVWSCFFLWGPTVLLTGYLMVEFPGFLHGYAWRGFTLGERLLTESRVLFLYVAKAFVPSPAGIRILYDDLPLSTSLIQPWTTAVALSGWLALVGAAIRLRRLAPVFSLAVAWYLIGHLLESTIIPLELAYDHRNYAPTLGPALALCVGLAKLLSLPLAQRLRPVIGLGSIAYLASLAAGLWLSADLWNRPLDQARYWVKQQPDSHRALYHYGEKLVAHQQWAEALSLYRGAEARWPDDPVAPLKIVELSCLEPRIAPDLPEVRRRLRAYQGSDPFRALGQLERLAGRLERGECAHHEPRQVLELIDAALASPKFLPLRLNLYYASAKLLHASGDIPQALARLEHAISLDPQVPFLQYAIVWNLQQGDVPGARRFLGAAESTAPISARTRWIYRDEIRGMRQLIELYETAE